jgi:hypothetical protein
MFALLFVLVVVAATPVFAQNGAVTTGPPIHDNPTYAIRAGVMFPQGSTQSNTLFSAGVEIFGPMSAMNASTSGGLTLSADYVPVKTSDGAGGTKTVSLIPVLLGWEGHSTVGQSGSTVDLGLGVGVYWATDTIPDMNITNTVNFAYGASIGYHFTPSWFVQGRFLANGNESKDGLIGVELGYQY